MPQKKFFQILRAFAVAFAVYILSLSFSAPVSAASIVTSGTFNPDPDISSLNGTFFTDSTDGFNSIQALAGSGDWVSDQIGQGNRVASYALPSLELCQNAQLESLEVNFLFSAPESLANDTAVFSAVVDANTTTSASTAREVTLVTSGSSLSSYGIDTVVGYSNNPTFLNNFPAGSVNLPVRYTVSLSGLSNEDLPNVRLAVVHQRDVHTHSVSSTQPTYILSYNDSNCQEQPQNPPTPELTNSAGSKSTLASTGESTRVMSSIWLALTTIILGTFLFNHFTRTN